MLLLEGILWTLVHRGGHLIKCIKSFDNADQVLLNPTENDARAFDMIKDMDLDKMANAAIGKLTYSSDGRSNIRIIEFLNNVVTHVADIPRKTSNGHVTGEYSYLKSPHKDAYRKLQQLEQNIDDKFFEDAYDDLELSDTGGIPSHSKTITNYKNSIRRRAGICARGDELLIVSKNIPNNDIPIINDIAFEIASTFPLPECKKYEAKTRKSSSSRINLAVSDGKSIQRVNSLVNSKIILDDYLILSTLLEKELTDYLRSIGVGNLDDEISNFLDNLISGRGNTSNLIENFGDGNVTKIQGLGDDLARLVECYQDILSFQPKAKEYQDLRQKYVVLTLIRKLNLPKPPKVHVVKAIKAELDKMEEYLGLKPSGRMLFEQLHLILDFVPIEMRNTADKMKRFFGRCESKYKGKPIEGSLFTKNYLISCLSRYNIHMSEERLSRHFYHTMLRN